MELPRDKRVLILVESPEKSRHITEIFRKEGYKNVIVQATIGHFTKIKPGSGYYNTGIHPEKNFEVDYELDESKKDNIKKLKEQVKIADLVLVCSDPDREGEAIGWSCVKFLNIPKSKYKRVTYNAINKEAIFKGIEEAHELNQNLVDAAHARSMLDLLIGFPFSQYARRYVQCKSVGRCQSAANKIIVEREEEIQNFKPEKYFDLYLHFIKGEKEFKAKYQGTDSTPVKQIKTQEEIAAIYNVCKEAPAEFKVTNIIHKDKNDYPKPPFCTATFQQEVASKLGLSSKQAMDLAQKLFESGKISYHRTDDECFEEDFENILKSFVKKKYGSDYAANAVKKGKKDDNAQEAHEALHVLDLNLTPELFAEDSSNELLTKVYRIIYNRTVASCLKPAVIAETTYEIHNKDHRFTMVSNELRFDGYKKVYSYKDDSDSDDAIVKETFANNEILNDCSLESIPKETKPRPRFKEAAFLQELKDRGIGRPSTYATIIETVLKEDRGYCVVEKKEMVPTEKGIKLKHYLDDNFEELFDLDFTKEMEKNLDLIAQGKTNYIDFVRESYNKVDSELKKVEPQAPQVEEKICPKCGKPLKLRKGPYGYFLGCTGYPKCTYNEQIKKKS